MSATPDEIRKLSKAVQTALKKAGFTVAKLAIVPDGNGPLELQVLLIPDPEPVVDGTPMSSEEDDLLAGIAAATRAEEETKRATETRKSLEELQQQLRNPRDGIL